MNIQLKTYEFKMYTALVPCLIKNLNLNTLCVVIQLRAIQNVWMVERAVPRDRSQCPVIEHPTKVTM